MKVGSVHPMVSLRAKPFLTALLLVVVTLAVYAPTREFSFLNFDDNEYVTANSHLKLGLTWDGLVWAFTTNRASNWHPLTWLSHMLDVGLWGMNPAGHHVTNVLFHAANTALLFLLLHVMTGALWRSAFAAALFALHPLHVESVAWVAERKDVLSTFFGLLAILAYVRYAQRAGVCRYLLILFCFALSLMAKPMLVTLPFLLLLLDHWPLARGEWARPRNKSGPAPRYRQKRLAALLLEKCPLLVLSAACSVMTLFAQSRGGSVLPFDSYDLAPRAANALISYLGYIGKAIWPIRLAPFYPLSLSDFTWWKIAGALLLLSAISLTVLRTARSYPYLATGWLWYLGALVPVIGLIQVGAQSMADRYTYVPLIGIFVMAAWGLAEVTRRGPTARLWVAVSACLLLAVLALLTRIQLGYWHDTIALFRRTLEVTRDNWLAHNNLGVELAQAGSEADARLHFQEAIRIKPSYARARANLADILRRQGKLQEALAVCDGGGKKDADLPGFHINRGMILFSMGRYQEAIQEYHQALRLDPANPAIHFNLASVFSRAGNADQAIREYRAALQLKPDYLEASNNLGAFLGELGKADEAIAEYRSALQFRPDSPELHYNLAIELAGQGKSDEAIYHLQQALKVKPDYTAARIWLGKMLAKGQTR